MVAHPGYEGKQLEAVAAMAERNQESLERDVGEVCGCIRGRGGW